MKQHKFTYEKVEKVQRAEVEKLLGTQNKREAAREATQEDFASGEHARIAFKTREDRKYLCLINLYSSLVVKVAHSIIFDRVLKLGNKKLHMMLHK